MEAKCKGKTLRQFQQKILVTIDGSSLNQLPIAKYELTDLFSELIKRNVEIRIVDNLWEFAEKVKNSTLIIPPGIIHIFFAFGNTFVTH